MLDSEFRKCDSRSVDDMLCSNTYEASARVKETQVGAARVGKRLMISSVNPPPHHLARLALLVVQVSAGGRDVVVMNN